MENRFIIEVKERDGKYIAIKQGGKKAYCVCDLHSEAIDFAQDLCDRWGCRLSDLNAPPNSTKTYVITKGGICPEVEGEELLVPTFEIASNPTIKKSEVKKIMRGDYAKQEKNQSSIKAFWLYLMKKYGGWHF